MIRKKYNGSLKDYSNVYYTKDCGTTNDVSSREFAQLNLFSDFEDAE